MAVPKKVLKRQTLRNIEYYGLQEIFDELYQKSLENRKFRRSGRMHTFPKYRPEDFVQQQSLGRLQLPG